MVAVGQVPTFTDGVSWFIRSLFVLLVLVSFVLIVWQLVSR
jgi:hypothetical protein